MSRRISAVAAALLSLFCVRGSPALADTGPAEHHKVAVGYHDSSAPLGVRWWLGSQKVAVDLGFGFHSQGAAFNGFPDEKLTGWSIGAGVPIVVKSWPRVHVLFRPGVVYSSQQDEDPSTPLVFDTDDETDLFVTALIECEAFVLENFSVSAATGIAYESYDPPFGGEKETYFMTHGRNFTQIGFHLYLFR